MTKLPAFIELCGIIELRSDDRLPLLVDESPFFLTSLFLAEGGVIATCPFPNGSQALGKFSGIFKRRVDSKFS